MGLNLGIESKMAIIKRGRMGKIIWKKEMKLYCLQIMV